MKIIKGNVWDLINGYDGICILTNGFVKNNGNAVMGRGIALQASKLDPRLPTVLGKSLKEYGNITRKVPGYKKLYFFPTKHNWWEKSDIELIKKSLIELIKIIPKGEKVLLPLPGCGNGGLDWETEVKPKIKDIITDNIHLITY